MINVNKILTKNKWSGKDVGMLKIANKTDFKRRANTGDYSTDPLILPGDLNYMASTLSEKEKNVLSGYIALCEWAENYSIGAANMAQQAQAGYIYLNSWLEKATIVENALTYIERLPVVMTPKQYSEEIEKNLPLIMEDDQGIFSLKDLILYAANAMLRDLKADGRKSNPLKPIKKKYLSEQVKLPKILARYNDVTERGYYQLSDGRRSDQMQTREWNIFAEKISGTIDTLIRNGRTRFEVDGRETARAVHTAFLRKDNILRDQERDPSLPFTWIEDKTQPEKLSKWEAFESDLTMYDLSPEELSAEFPEIIAATIKEIEERDYFDISLSDAPIEQWDDSDRIYFTYEELYELNFFGFKEEKDFEAAALSTGSRGQLFGVAVLKRNPAIKELPLNVDQEGNYFAPSTFATFELNGLGAFFEKSPDSSFYKREANTARSNFIRGTYYALAYDSVLRETMKQLKIDDLDCYIIPEGYFNGMMDTYSRSYHNLRTLIQLAQYDQDLKAKKLAILDDLFTPFDKSLFDIPEGIMEEVREEIRNKLNFFSNQDLQIRLLTRYPVKE